MWTDLTLVCVPCRTRTHASKARCPRCRARRLVRGTEVERDTLDAIDPAEPPPVRRPRPHAALWRHGTRVVGWMLRERVQGAVSLLGMPLGASLAVWAAFADGTSPTGWDEIIAWVLATICFAVAMAAGLWAIWLCLLFAAAILLPVLYFVFWLSSWPAWAAMRIVPSLRLRRPPGLVIAVDANPRPADWIEGRVSPQSSTLRSPIAGGACVAFRLAGKVGDDEVDDGGAMPFDLVTEEGRRVRVEPKTAVVDVEKPDPQVETPDASGDALGRFLRDRAILLADRAVRIGESVLCEGDVARVAGETREEPDPDATEGGYREARTRSVVSGTVVITARRT